MDKIERARKLYELLEGNDKAVPTELARRNFCIQELLAENKD